MAHRENKKAKTIFSFFKPRDEISTSGAPSSLTSVDMSIPNEQSPPCVHAPSPSDVNTSIPDNQPPNIQGNEFDASSLERDPGLRTPIMQEPINQRDMIRRAYIKMGPYQPKPKHREYPRSKFGDQYRRFQYAWFQQFPWLEYSPSKDAAFCFPCFLFEKKTTNCPTLALEGFRNWKRVNDGKRCVFLLHVGGPNSPHNKAVKSVEDLMNVVGHVDKVLNAQSLEEIKKNRLRLAASIKSIRWLTAQSCALRGNDESTDSSNRGNFLEMLKLMGELDVNIHEVVLDKAPKNASYTSPMIQKEILHICGKMVRNKIREELGDGKFCILVDEAKDASNKEQMAIVLRYVDVHGFIRERFFEIVRVADTTASTLKQEICDVLARHNIDIQNMRGQGYDGASNMRGAWNGLQALFLRDCPYAYYIHCFAHRLQLALVGAAQDEPSVWLFFSKLSVIVNLLSASPKRLAELQSAQVIEIAKEIASNERATGRGANQIGSLQRAGKTRWSSHFESICSLVDMFGASIKVLQEINDNPNERGQTSGASIAMKSFDFVFIFYISVLVLIILSLLK